MWHPDKIPAADPAAADMVNPGHRLRKLYLLALGLLASLAISGLVLVQIAIPKQSTDSRLINVAGRQRMLSQELTKVVLTVDEILDHCQEGEEPPFVPCDQLEFHLVDLRRVLDLWTCSHLGLQHGDSGLDLPGANGPEVVALFEKIEAHYRAMRGASERLLASVDGAASPRAEQALRRSSVTIILNHEGDFLTGMDDIVSRYEEEARGRVARVRNTELVLMILMLVILLVLLLEILFVFIPTGRVIRRQFAQLSRSEARQRAVLASTRDPMITTDRQGIVQFASDSVEPVFRWKPQELVGQNVTILMPENYRPGHCQGLSEWSPADRRGELALVREFDGLRKDGTTFPCELSVTQVELPTSNGMLFTAIIRDITESKRAEEALRENGLWMRSIFGSLDEGVIVVTPDRCISNVNGAAVRMFGYAKDELAHRSTEILHVDHEHYLEFGKRIQEAFDHGETAHFEFEFKRKNGELFPTEHTVSLLKNDEGKAVGIVRVVRDITEPKRAEEALRQVAEGVSAATGDAFFRSLVQHLAAALGFDHAFVGEVTPDSSDRINTLAVSAHSRIVENIDYELANTPCENVIARGFCVYPEGVCRQFPLDGLLAEMNVESYAGMPLFGADGEVMGFLAVLDSKPLRDAATVESLLKIFTVRAAAELERRRAEQERIRLAAVVEQAAESIVITDTKGTIQYVNAAFECITGFTREEAIGQNPRILKSDEHDQAFYRELWDAITRGEVWKGRFFNRKKDGTLFEVKRTIFPIRDASGAIVSYVAVGPDITHESALEAQLRHAQKMEAVGTLAAGIAHDIRNVLTVIYAHAAMAKNRTKDEELLRSLRGVEEAVEQATSVTRSLLTFSQKVPAQKSTIDLCATVEKATRMLRRTFPASIELLVDTSAEPAPWVMADSTQLQQVVLNLAINARDAMPDGGVLRISVSPPARDAGRAAPSSSAGTLFTQLIVEDTGAGMSSETQARVFEPFFTTKPRSQGTGLGLGGGHK